MRFCLRAAGLALLAGLIPACDLANGVSQGNRINTTVSGLLRGSQVIPALGTGASGTADFVVGTSRRYVEYTIDATGLATAVTAIEVRLGAPGTNGPAIFTVPLGAFPISGSLTSADFTPQNGVFDFDAAADAVAAGTTYLLLSTAAQPAGEIRAHLGAATLAASVLNGSQVDTPIVTTGTGAASVALDRTQTSLTVSLGVSMLANVTGAQIFDGPPGTDSTQPLFDIATAPFTNIVATLTAGDFTASAGAATFEDAVNLLLSGGLYIEVLTGAEPNGEIRGQVGPTQLNATLTAADVFPPNTSTATGSATLSLNAAQNAVFVTLTHSVAAPDRVGINVESPGANGPKIFDVDAIAGAATSPLTATVTPSRLIPNAPQNILTFADAVNAILTGRTYIEVGNASFPGGEIRGQILP